MNKLFLIFIVMFISACSTGNKNISEKIGSSPGCKSSDYHPAETSEYSLPYPVGKKYRISQGNCGIASHIQFHSTGSDIRFAYDFVMPIGEKVTAARGGVVINIEDSYSNETNMLNETNFVGIKHKDDTVALYFHFSPKGVLVNVGDTLVQGDLIGISGSSGLTAPYPPHLHFEVRKRDSENCDLSGYVSTNPESHKLTECKSIPISFKNAEPSDVPLREDKAYKAFKIDPE